MSIIRAKLKLGSLLVVFILLSSFYAFHTVSLWQNAVSFSSDASTALNARVKTAKWLSQNLTQNETALVSLPFVYYALNSSLRGRLIDYRYLWDLARVPISQRDHRQDVLKVRSYFIDFLMETPQLKYVIRDWGDIYSTSLYTVTANDDLFFLLREVAAFPFVLSTGWSNKIVIYERMQYSILLANDLTFPPKQFSLLPRDVRIQFDSYVATIQKASPRVGFYLPLEKAINTSKQNYLTMQIKLDFDDLNLTTIFYYDRNRDGKFSGYEIDYVRSATFSQTKLGWVAGEWYTIS